LFGLQTEFILDEVTEDWTGENHGGEPFFYYRYECQLSRGDRVIANSFGSCNSWEKKYRYRTSDLLCPDCGKSGTVIKGRQEYGGGWLCFGKKGGCGSKWSDGSKAIEGQERGEVKNPNPSDLVNTVQKMAQKRALVATTLIAANASEFFTQDIEDMDFGVVVDAKATEVKEKPAKKEQPETNGNAVTIKDWGEYYAYAKKHIDKEEAQAYADEHGNPQKAYEAVAAMVAKTNNE
jgi:hypothetical protein